MPVIDGNLKLPLTAATIETLMTSIPNHSSAHDTGGSDQISSIDGGSP